MLYHLLLWGGPRGHRGVLHLHRPEQGDRGQGPGHHPPGGGPAAREGPTSEELERAREQSKANVVMGLESTQSRMSHAGRSLLFSGEILTPEQIIAAYDSVTHEDVVALAQEIFRWDQVSLSAVGQVRTAEAYRALVLEA